MKVLAIYAAIVVAIVIATAGLLYGLRLFNQAVTPITVHRPEPGIVCVSMVTADGVALSCISEPPK